MLALWLKVSLVALLDLLVSSPQTTRVFIPTSVVLNVARKIAANQGYSIHNEKAYFFDMVTPKDGQPYLPGYVTVNFYGNSNLLNTISINEQTGQVVDSVACLVFEYPDLGDFQRELRRRTGAKATPAKELMSEIGCPSFRILKRSIRKAIDK